MRRLKKKKQTGQNLFSLGFVIFICILLATFIVLKNQNNTNRVDIKDGINSNIIVDINIYPGSKKEVYNINNELITVNYKVNFTSDYKEVIDYYRQNLPKKGWRLVSSKDKEVIFEKNSRTLRIWILYSSDNNNEVDYIIDYKPGNK